MIKTEKILPKQKSQTMLCPKCKNKVNNWKEIYYVDSAKLVKSEKLFLGMCLTCNDYILLNF